MYLTKVEVINDLNRERANLQDSLCIAMATINNEVDRANDQASSGLFEKIGDGLEQLKNEVAGLGLYVIGKVRQFFFNVMETIVTMLYQTMVYLMLFLRLVFRGVLGIMGPLALAFSILPMWRRSFSQWLAKYVTVSLYGCITYIILTLSTAVVQYAIRSDIEVLQRANLDDTAMAMQTIFSTGYVNGWIPAMLMTIIAIGFVPKIADWLLAASTADAAGGAASKAKEMAAGTVKTVANII